MKNPRSLAIKRLDTLWSLAIRRQDPICRKCKSSRSTQAAHIFTRNNMSTRWDLENGWGACYYCHIIWSHREPLEFAAWIRQDIGEKEYLALEKRTRTLQQFSLYDYPAIRRTLLL